MRPRFVVIVLAVLATASGSTAFDLSAQDTVTVRAAQPEWGAHPRVMEEMRVGVLEGDERYTFGAAWDVALGDDTTCGWQTSPWKSRTTSFCGSA